jgi:hypothetical protein
MSTTKEDDLDTMPEAEILAMPGGAIPPGWLTAFFTRRTALIRQHERDELALELSGDSARHLMISPDQDPRVMRRREEEQRRRAWLAEQEMLEYRQCTDRLLAQIEDQQCVIEKRRKEIQDNAIRLHDGRRAYVDGNRYVDEQGRELTCGDRDAAAEQHRLHPDASTWEQKQDIDRRADEAKRLKDKVLKDRESGEGTPEEKRQRLSGYEEEFAGKIAARQEAMGGAADGEHNDPVTDYGNADYLAELGGEYTVSMVPAFTRAAQGGDQTPTAERKDTENEAPQTQNTPRPNGQGAPKLRTF